MKLELIDLAKTLAIPCGRSIGGWATLALKDKKITNFEFIKLGETILKTSIYGTLIYLGADGFGLELSTISAGASAIILDMVLTAFKENRNITKR